MAINPIVEMNAKELSRAIHSKKVSCVEVMEGYLSHIEVINPHVNAIVQLQDRDDLLSQAKEKDAQLAQGKDNGWYTAFPRPSRIQSRLKICMRQQME